MRTKKFTVFWQFVLLGTVVFVAIGTYLAALVEPALVEFILGQQKLNAVVFMNRLAADNLLQEDFEKPATGDSRERFGRFTDRLQIPGLFRVKIWNRENLMVYSTNEDLIGKLYPPHEEVEEAFKLKVTAEIEEFDPDDPHFAYDDPFTGDTLEIYAPITFGDSPEVIGVVETYSRAGFLFQEIDKVRDEFVRRIATSLLFMFAALSYIVWRASRTVTQQQAELYTYATGLEKMVKDRTRALEESIRKQLEQAKELSQLKDEFVSLAAHQLRTPPSIVNWYTEMLLSQDVGRINDKQKKYLEEIYGANQRMIELVNDFLNISRIEMGTLAIVPEPADLKKITDEVLAELAPKVHERRTVIEKHYAKDLPLMHADPKIIRIILENLLSNAVKYTPKEGSVSVRIEPAPPTEIPSGEPAVRVTVRDSGYGIPRAQQEKVFTKLFRADNVADKESEGTGLGLYLTKSVVETSGGRIWFESEEGKGSTFYVVLPQIMKKREGVRRLT